ncbi:MAG: hypothetical protein ACTHN5_14970 [Phycisphaerae bacterium]
MIAIFRTWCMVGVLCLLCLARAAMGTEPAASQPGSPFTMNGWQFHEYNVPRLENAIAHAPDYGVNFFIFSHNLFRSVEGFLASDDRLDVKNPPAYLKELYTPEYFTLHAHWIRDINHLGELANAKGIPFYLWVHELDDIPLKFLKGGRTDLKTQEINRLREQGQDVRRARVDMDDPALYAYLTQRYEKLLAAVPNCAGFVLTLHESDFKVFRNDDVISSVDRPERIYKVAMLLHDVLAKHHKQLILRNFFYEPMEMRYFREAIAKLPDDIIIMSKDMTHEFDPFYPYDPLHGDVGKKKQIIETDLGSEKAWSTQGGYAQTDFIRRVVLRARQTGLAGVVGRMHVYYPDPFANTHEVNLYAFSRFMRNPDLSDEEVLTDWAAKRFPKEAVPAIVSAYGRTEWIQHHGRWHLEEWFTKDIGSEWGSYAYYYGHLLERGRSKWTLLPSDIKLEEKLFHPDEGTYERLVAEKEEVIRQVRASQADVEKAAPFLSAEQSAQVRGDFDFLADAAVLQEAWIRAYFSMRMAVDDPGNAEYKARMEAALADMEKQEKAGPAYGLNKATGRRYNIDKFEADMRAKAADPEKTKAEDAKILATVRHTVDAANR